MDSEPIMPLKPPYITHFGPYRYRKLPANFSDKASACPDTAPHVLEGRSKSNYL